MRILTLIGLAAILPALTGARPLALDDSYRWQTVSDPRVSADARRVAYALSTPDRDTDADISSIWLVDRDGRNARQLSPAMSNERNPRWSTDGRYLALLSDRGKPNSEAQIWVVDTRNGDAVHRSRFKGSIADFSWSADDKRIVFSGVEATVDDLAAGGKPLSIVIDRLHFKQDFNGYLGNARSHLYLLDLGSGAISQLTHGAADEIQPAWSPDGASIVFLTKAGAEPDAHDNWDFFLIDPRPGSTPRQLTDTPEMENDPVWGRGYGPPRFSPDGRRLAYVRGGDPKDSWFGLVQLTVSGIDGSAAQLPTRSLDRLTLDPHWSADGRWVYFLLEDDRSQLLARLRLKDGQIERLTHADSVVSEFDVASDGAVVAIYGTSNQPGELVAIEHGRIRPLTHHNDGWAREVSLVAAKNIEFESADGTGVNGSPNWACRGNKRISG